MPSCHWYVTLFFGFQFRGMGTFWSGCDLQMYSKDLKTHSRAHGVARFHNMYNICGPDQHSHRLDSGQVLSPESSLGWNLIGLGNEMRNWTALTTTAPDNGSMKSDRLPASDQSQAHMKCGNANWMQLNDENVGQTCTMSNGYETCLITTSMKSGHKVLLS